MKSFPTVVSYYTLQTPYESEIENLLSSCKKYGIKTSVDGIDPFGTWELNCAYKPFFLLKKLQEVKGPLLWVDADGRFMQSPNWIEAFEADFSVRIHENLPWNHPSKVISSTIFVNPTKPAIRLLKFWAFTCQRYLTNPKRRLEFWDQIALRDALYCTCTNATISSLPLSYAKIFDHPDDCKKIDLPVIEHYQASRRFKKLVDTAI